MRDVSWQPWTHTYHGSELNMPQKITSSFLLTMTKGGVSSCASYVLPKCSGVKGLGSSPCMFTDMLFFCWMFPSFPKQSINSRMVLARSVDRPRRWDTFPLIRTHPLTLDGWKTTFLMGCTVFSGYVSFKEWCSRINPAYTEICTCLCILCLKHVSNIVGSDETQVYVYIYIPCIAWLKIHDVSVMCLFQTEQRIISRGSVFVVFCWASDEAGVFRCSYNQQSSPSMLAWLSCSLDLATVSVKQMDMVFAFFTWNPQVCLVNFIL